MAVEGRHALEHSTPPRCFRGHPNLCHVELAVAAALGLTHPPSSLSLTHACGVWQATLEDAEAKLKTEHAQLVASNLQQNWGTNLELSPRQMADIITEEMTEEGTLDVVEQRVALQKQEKVEHMLDRVENQEAKVGRRHRKL
jgi:hypothetical protein